MSPLDVEVNPHRPYTFENETLDTYLELRYGSEKQIWPMDRTSNGDFIEVCWIFRELLFIVLMPSQDEFKRMKTMFEHHKVKLPSKRALEQKMEQQERLPNTSVTDVSCFLFISYPLAGPLFIGRHHSNARTKG